MSEITNLRMSSYFSLEDSLLSVDDIINHALENKQSTVSMTNKGRMFSTINFYEKARKNGLKPIIGLDAFIENDLTVEDKHTSRILIIAKNENGYKNLMKLNSKAAIENSINGMPVIKESWLKDGVSDLIALSGEDIDNLFFKGFEDRDNLSKEELKNLIQQKSNFIEQYKTFFPAGFFIEIMRTGRKQEDNFVRMMLNLSAKTNTPIVATQSAKFKTKEEFADHLVHSALNLSEYVEPKAMREEFSRSQYLLSSKEMRETFKDLSGALDNANTIGKMCNVKIKTGADLLPDFDTPNGESADDYLRILALNGLDKKLAIYFPDEKKRNEKRPQYLERMNYELQIIKDKNFSNYFLIVSDFVKYAKLNNISVGVGRGSAVGSLITTLIDITDIDPIRHNLLFERFLNPERVSMPDIDIDFPSAHRKKIVEYLSDKYNHDDKISVAQIGTFNNYKPKSSLQATAKVLDLPYSLINLVRNSVNNYERKNKSELKSFADLLLFDSNLKEETENNIQLARFIRYAEASISTPSNVSKHASGVVISNGDILNYTPLLGSNIIDKEDTISTQYDSGELEKVGLIKFDILGLKNLDLIDEIVSRINERPDYQNKKFDIEKIDFNDPTVYNIFKTANTGGIFQFESDQMKKLLLKVQADNFGDIIAANALVRPSAAKYVDSYAKRKSNQEKVEYLHPLLENITKDTYGFLIYQEQVMQAAKLISGYSLGEADLLRKAMSKKDTAIMKSQKERFISGAEKLHNMNHETAEKLFEDIEQFAEYGFNKAHSVAYSVTAYRNAYLKQHFPVEFYSASLNQCEKDKMPKIIEDLYRNDFKLLSPDVNNCSAFFEINNENKEIMFGLSAVKGINEVVANKIIKIRETYGGFSDIYDFCEKVGREDLNERLFSNMINAGCFDSITSEGDDIIEKRSLLLSNASSLINYSAKNSRLKKEKGFILNDLFGQEGLFKNASKPYDVDFDLVDKPKIVPPVNEEGQPIEYLLSESDVIEKESDAIGVCLSINPLEKYTNKIGGMKSSGKLINVSSMETNDHLFCGILVDKKLLKTKKDVDFMIIKVADGTTTQEISMFDQYKIDRINDIPLGDFISFKKFTNKDGFNRLDESRNLEETQCFLSKRLNIALPGEKLKEVVSLLEQHKGNKEVVLYTPEMNSNSYAMLKLPIKVNITIDLNKKLAELLGDKKFLSFDYYSHFKFKKSKPKNENNNNWKKKLQQR